MIIVDEGIPADSLEGLRKAGVPNLQSLQLLSRNNKNITIKLIDLIRAGPPRFKFFYGPVTMPAVMWA